MAKITPEQLHDDLSTYSREPFLESLRLALLHAPSPQAIADMAERSPVAWSDYIVKLSKLYGYQEASTVNHTHRLIRDMSSEEIAAEVKRSDEKSQATEVEFKEN